MTVILRPVRVLGIILVVGCAGPALSSPQSGPATVPSLHPEEGRRGGPLAAFRQPALDELSLGCQDRACPEGVGLLVRYEAGELQRCTASLVGPARALTASHCLPHRQRARGATCHDTWLLFAAGGRQSREWVQCHRVIRASPVRDDEVVRPDIAVIELARPVHRRPLRLSASSLDDAVIVGVAAVSPHPIYSLQHWLSIRLCRVATLESAVDAFGPGAERVGWLLDCPAHPGNSGAPVLDRRDRVRAVLHGGSDPARGISVLSRVEPSITAAP